MEVNLKKLMLPKKIKVKTILCLKMEEDLIFFLKRTSISLKIEDDLKKKSNQPKTIKRIYYRQLLLEFENRFGNG